MEVTGICPPQLPVLLGVHGEQHRRRFVPVNSSAPLEKGHLDHVGYVSIFPLLLRLFPQDSSSPRLQALLKIVESRSLLWTDYGLRSIATSDPFYLQGNAEGDHAYWRGPIWININYLALGALHYYAQGSGPHKDRAARLYRELRVNLMETVVGNFRETGFFWEQFDDRTGEGMRNRPFSGWTALILNVMSELY